jgi:hypothetical protein
VLEAIHVYWHLLDGISKGVLVHIHRLCFNYLWKGSSEYLGSHLAKWKVISKHKILRGWGLKDMWSFSKALATKSLWIFLTSISLWRLILIAKYIEPNSLLDWIGQPRKNVHNASNQWWAVSQDFPIIG